MPANENTVTIPLEEYMDLRQKADMNAYLMSELGETRQRLSEFDRRLFDVEERVREIQRDGR